MDNPGYFKVYTHNAAIGGSIGWVAHGRRETFELAREHALAVFGDPARRRSFYSAVVITPLGDRREVARGTAS